MNKKKTYPLYFAAGALIVYTCLLYTSPGVRIVTIQTAHGASLEKDDHADSGTVYGAEAFDRMDFTCHSYRPVSYTHLGPKQKAAFDQGFLCQLFCAVSGAVFRGNHHAGPQVLYRQHRGADADRELYGSVIPL